MGANALGTWGERGCDDAHGARNGTTGVKKIWKFPVGPWTPWATAQALTVMRAPERAMGWTTPAPLFGGVSGTESGELYRASKMEQNMHTPNKQTKTRASI